jgi:hypothetical protein
MSENKVSQYDFGLVLKDVHDLRGHSLRVVDGNSLVRKYTHFDVTYDGNGLPTNVVYKYGLEQHLTNLGFVADSGGSLTSTYFTFRKAPSDALYYVWYRVDGIGTDPAIPNGTGIVVDIQSNDMAEVVALATSLTINATYPDYFLAQRTGATAVLRVLEGGVVTNSSAGTTGFLLTNTPGTEEIVGNIFIPYVGQNPVFEGQVLNGYVYNIYTAKFEKLPSLDFSNTEITKKTTLSTYGEKLGIASGITELVATVTAGVDQLLGQVVFSGTNVAEFELVINSATIDKQRTYFGNSLNGSFEFPKGLQLTSGDTIEVFAIHTRPTNADFNARIEIWEY